MTMNVSVRVPDGIVLATDSLASSIIPVQQQVSVALKCGKCGNETPPGIIQVPPVPVPGSSTPLASKLFYVGNYGLTFFGASAINGRSMFNHVMVYRTTKYKSEMQLGDIADGIAEQLEEAIAADKSLQKAPKGAIVGGFQICGYDEGDIDIGRTIVVHLKVGEGAAREEVGTGYGATVTGYQAIAKMLFSLPSGGQSAQPNYASMTIPDAVDYARFLVQTTSDYHRFADMVPTVGGPTEIALITKWIGFRWVERKKILGDDTTRLNIGKVSHEIGQIRRDLPDIIRRSREPSPDQGVEP
jgi:hypothetical protein